MASHYSGRRHPVSLTFRVAFLNFALTFLDEPVGWTSIFLLWLPKTIF